MAEKLHRKYTGLTKEVASHRATVILETGKEDGVTRVEVLPDGKGKYDIYVYIDE